MKNRVNIFSNDKITNFLKTSIANYEMVFTKLSDIDYNSQTTEANIIVITNNKDLNLIDFNQLKDNYLIMSCSKKNNLNLKSDIKFINIPLNINQLRNKIENFVQNLKVNFHDMAIDNDRLTNIKNNSFCYLTKVEFEILRYLIRVKKTNKNYIKENILNIKSNIQTNSLESHLTRIRKKMNKIGTTVKIQTKNEKLLIVV